MMDLSKSVPRQIKFSYSYLTLLGITLVFFVYKGISYALIGSFVPLITITIILILFIFTSKKSPNALRQMIVFWAVLLILWSSTRLLLSIVNLFVKPVPEAHVHDQLGIGGAIFSLIFLSIAIYLWRFKKSILN